MTRRCKLVTIVMTFLFLALFIFSGYWIFTASHWRPTTLTIHAPYAAVVARLQKLYPDWINPIVEDSAISPATTHPAFDPGQQVYRLLNVSHHEISSDQRYEIVIIDRAKFWERTTWIIVVNDAPNSTIIHVSSELRDFLLNRVSRDSSREQRHRDLIYREIVDIPGSIQTQPNH